jgi:hypothetical protein
MALLEAHWSGEDGFINKYLVKQMKGRPLESLKKKRQSADYRSLVARYKVELEEAADDNVFEAASSVEVIVVPPSPSSSPSGEIEEFSILERLSASEPPRSAPPVMTVEDRNATILRCRFVEANVASHDRELLDILFQARADAIRAIDLMVAELIPPPRTTVSNIKASAGEVVSHTYATSSKRSEKRRSRAQNYKMAQQMFRNDTARLARSVLDDIPLACDGVTPSVEIIENTYRPIFESVDGGVGLGLNHDRRTCNSISEELLLELNGPILNSEIDNAFATIKSKARGPDGITCRGLAGWDPSKRLLCYNLMFYWGYIPDVLKNCRTTLIPKTRDGLDDINNWRPLTIGSMLLKSFSKLMLKRLNKVPIHHAQKGFTKDDGVMYNNVLLDSIIRDRRAASWPYTIVSLDLKRAFDTVEHPAIERALQSKGISGNFFNFVRASYEGCNTTITCGKNTSRPLALRRGVKQGDPLSAGLFNLVLDQFIQSLPVDCGIAMNNEYIPLLAYADDILLLAPSKREARLLLEKANLFFKSQGMSLNVNKCSSLIVETIPRTKKLVARPQPYFAIDDLSIRPVTTDHFKYLGGYYSCFGSKPPSNALFHLEARRLLKSPLKPSQKLYMANTYLFPRVLARLQHLRVSKKILARADFICRALVKSILHLPKTTPNAYLHAARNDGGLGVPHFAQKIPVVMYKRLENCLVSAMGRPFSEETFRKAQNLFLSIAGGVVRSSEAQKRQTAENLEVGYSGNGIRQVGNVRRGSRWIEHPPTNWSGATFVKAVQLRGNMLPTVGIPSNPPDARKCRGGCQKVESLSHVVQGCYVTHEARIARHDHTCSLISKFARKSGWAVEAEPRIRLSDGTLRKPDLLLTNAQYAVICDIGVHWEGQRDLEVSFAEKLAIYNNVPLISHYQLRFPTKQVIVHPCILGARGTLAKSNNRLMDLLSISLADQHKLIHDVIVGSIACHSSFMKRVWCRRESGRGAASQ